MLIMIVMYNVRHASKNSTLCPPDGIMGKCHKDITLVLFLPRDASAERGDATVSRLSVCLSVRP